MKQPPILYIKLFFALLSVLVVIFGHAVVTASLFLLSFGTELLMLFLTIAVAQGDSDLILQSGLLPQLFQT